MRFHKSFVCLTFPTYSVLFVETGLLSDNKYLSCFSVVVKIYILPQVILIGNVTTVIPVII